VLAIKNNAKIARLGVIVAKKNLKLATKRNKVKRIIRENFRQNQVMLSGLDIVVMLRNGAKSQNTGELHTCLKRHWFQISNCKKKY